jgi:hypothetical protein
MSTPIDDDDRCPLHDLPLVEGSVPVVYGFIGTSPEYGPAWRTRFRYSWSCVAGGCSVAAGRPSTRTVLYCPRCREEERRWIAERIKENPDEDSWEWFVAGCLGLREEREGQGATQ